MKKYQVALLGTIYGASVGCSEESSGLRCDVGTVQSGDRCIVAPNDGAPNGSGGDNGGGRAGNGGSGARAGSGAARGSGGNSDAGPGESGGTSPGSGGAGGTNTGAGGIDASTAGSGGSTAGRSAGGNTSTGGAGGPDAGDGAPPIATAPFDCGSRDVTNATSLSGTISASSSHGLARRHRKAEGRGCADRERAEVGVLPRRGWRVATCRARLRLRAAGSLLRVLARQPEWPEKDAPGLRAREGPAEAGADTDVDAAGGGGAPAESRTCHVPPGNPTEKETTRIRHGARPSANAWATPRTLVFHRAEKRARTATRAAGRKKRFSTRSSTSTFRPCASGWNGTGVCRGSWCASSRSTYAAGSCPRAAFTWCVVRAATPRSSA
jgi:hypothetical protein